MTRHLLMTSSLGLLLATSAFAQTAPDPAATAAPTWPVGVSTAFFTDRSMTTLRAADEMRAQWATLSDVDQDLVRQDCGAINGGGATGTAATGTSATGTASDSMTGSGTDNADPSGPGMTSGNVDQGTDGFIGADGESEDLALGTEADTETDSDTTGGTAQTGTDAGTASTTAATGSSAGISSGIAGDTGTAGEPSSPTETATAPAEGSAATDTMSATEGAGASDTAGAEEADMQTTAADTGATPFMSTENLAQICALVNTL